MDCDASDTSEVGAITVVAAAVFIATTRFIVSYQGWKTQVFYFAGF